MRSGIQAAERLPFFFFQVYFYPAKKGQGAFIALLLGMFARECHVFESSSFVYPCLVTSKLSNSVDGCSSSRMGLPEKKRQHHVS